MIDTIKLSIPKDKFRINYPENFSPSAKGLLVPPYTKMGSRSYLKCVLNPTKSLIQKNGYLPRLALIKSYSNGYSTINLKVECSLPKILYNNNFDELDNSNFKNIAECIKSKLSILGIDVSINTIRHAFVDRVDFSKNIHLQNHVSSNMIINELSKASISSSIDIGQEKFRNNGQALHFHTKNRDIVFYDKIKDLQQAKKGESKAIENTNYIQLNLLDEIEPSNQVLRMEVRLNKKKEIESTIHRLGLKLEPTFINLFNSNLSQQILQFYWSKIGEASQHLKFKTEGVFDIAETMKSSYPDLKPTKLLKYIGAMVLSKEGGSRRLRSLLDYEGSSSKNRKWYKLQKEIRNLKYDNTNSFLAISEVSNGLDKYKPTKIKDLIKTYDKNNSFNQSFI